MKFRKQISIAAVGFASMGAQLVILRELMPASLGDELSVGLALFAWMLCAGAGSVLGGIISRRFKTSDSAAAALLFLHGVLAPLTVIWIRVYWNMSGRMYGELAPIETTVALSLAVMGPLCVATGALFPLLMNSGKKPGAAGAIYAWESVAAGLGGIVFSLAALPHLFPLAASIAAGAASMTAGVLWLSPKIRTPGIAVICAGLAAALFFSGAVERDTQKLIWGEGYYASAQSGYGSVTALKEDEQFSVYASGRFSSNVPDVVFGEYMAHIPMLAHPAPKSVLLVGASETAVQEILKHGVKNLSVAELDPAIMKMKIKLCGESCDALYGDSRVTVLTGDPRKYIERTSAAYDVIIVDAGAPETLQVNRYYTAEFIKATGNALAPGGLLAMTVPFSENYTGEDMIAMTGSIVATFPRTRESRPLPVPGPKTFFLWRPGTQAETSSETARERFLNRKIVSSHFNEDSAAYYFDITRIEFAMAQFSDDVVEYSVSEDRIGAALDWLRARPGAAPDQDFKPLCVYFGIRSALAYYKSPAGELPGKMKTAAEKISKIAWVFPVAALALLIAGFTGRAGRYAATASGIAAAGFSGMLMEVLLLLEFQALNGVMYQYMGLIMGAFLIGTAAGAAISGASMFRQKSGVIPVVIVSILFIFAPGANAAWLRSGAEASEYVIPGWAFLAGMIPGWVFGLAAKGEANDKLVFRAGIMYAADLAGACLAAIASSALLVPIYGVDGCLGIAGKALALSAAALAGVSLWRLFARKN